MQNTLCNISQKSILAPTQ